MPNSGKGAGLQSAIATGLRMLLVLMGAATMIAGMLRQRDLVGLIAYVQSSDFAVVCATVVTIASGLYELWQTFRANKTLSANGLKPSGSTSDALKVLLPFAILAPLAGFLASCATAGQTVKLDTGKAFYTAQIAFLSAQQTTLAVCSIPTKPAACDPAIAVLAKGAQAEQIGFAAQQAGNAASLAAATQNLMTIPSQLATLGVLKAN